MKIFTCLDGSFDCIGLPVIVVLMLGALGSLFGPADSQPRGIVTVQALNLGEAGLLINADPAAAANPG